MQRVSSCEDQLLKRLIRREKVSPDVIVPNGDDAAVVAWAEGLLALSVDALVEGRHFDFAYSSPEQAGAKAVEAAISDVFAMGGRPKYLLLNLGLRPDLSQTLLERLYAGIYGRCDLHDLQVLGGNVSSGTCRLELSVTVLGSVASRESICRRSGARPGDGLYVTGRLGGSSAGLLALQRRLEGFEAMKKRHLEPRCRADIGLEIAQCASAMIDISDGLSTDALRLAAASGCGIEMYADRIPLFSGIEELCLACGCDALEMALHSGEEYELLFSAADRDVQHLLSRGLCVKIGELTNDRRTELILGGIRTQLKSGGFDHLAGILQDL